MAMAVASGGGGGGRRGRRGRKKPMSDINVTPMVDVMLVLLIVFMVAAPLLTVGVPVDLPQTAAKEMNTESKPVTVTINQDGALFIGEDPVAIEDLLAKVTELMPNGPGETIYVRGDQTANYGAVLKVMGLLSSAGYNKIGLVSAQDQVR